MDDTAKRHQIERYLAAYNAFDVDGMVMLLSDSVRFDNYAGGVLTASTEGRDAFRALAEQSRHLFSEREQRATSWHFEGDGVRVGIAYRGLLAVDVPNGPAAGSWLDLQGESEFGFRDGLIHTIVDRS